MNEARSYPLGDTALTIELGRAIDPQTQRRCRALDGRLQAAAPPGLIETVPSYASVMLVYDPLASDYATLSALALGLCDDLDSSGATARRWRVPACYEGACAEDLHEAAQVLGISAERLIEQHTGAEFEIALYGFAPGWAYLAGCPAGLAPPRRQSPRPPTPPDALMIAAGQAMLTARPMPTGWYVIGRSAQPPLNLRGDPPVHFDVGDRLQFYAVGEAEWNALYARANAGELVAEAIG